MLNPFEAQRSKKMPIVGREWNGVGTGSVPPEPPYKFPLAKSGFVIMFWLPERRVCGCSSRLRK